MINESTRTLAEDIIHVFEQLPYSRSEMFDAIAESAESPSADQLGQGIRDYVRNLVDERHGNATEESRLLHELLHSRLSFGDTVAWSAVGQHFEQEFASVST